MILHFGRLRYISLLLIPLLVWDLAAVAAPPAARAASARKRSTSRYGVPTYADSTRDDVADWDDPVVR
jgi:hypothetical protein